MSTTEAEFIQLRAENEALKALLAKHGIAVPQPSKFNIGDAALQPTANGLSQTAGEKALYADRALANICPYLQAGDRLH